MTKEIKFTLTVDELRYCAEFPSPAIKELPEWYKKTPSFIDNKKTINNGNFNETVKKCIPVLDSLSLGYIIKTWTDIYVEKAPNNGVHTSVNTKIQATRAVEGHPQEQAPFYPNNNIYGKDILKWINPWHIKTPKGYSCFFTTPIHRDLPFKILDGVVDTDVFPLTINFPFLMDKNFTGIIPCGTPMVQVFPFKRDSFKSIRGEYNHDEYNAKMNFHDTSFINKYKTKWWNRKEFK